MAIAVEGTHKPFEFVLGITRTWQSIDLVAECLGADGKCRLHLRPHRSDGMPPGDRAPDA
jgi:hypothetical protein